MSCGRLFAVCLFGTNAHQGTYVPDGFKCFYIIPYFTKKSKPFQEKTSPFLQKIVILHTFRTKIGL